MLIMHGTHIRLNHACAVSLYFPSPSEKAITLVHDSLNWLSVIPKLKPSDVIILLTSSITPVSRNPADNMLLIVLNR